MLFALFTCKFLRGAPPRTPLDVWLPPKAPIGYPILDERPRQVLHLVPTPRSRDVSPSKVERGVSVGRVYFYQTVT